MRGLGEFFKTFRRRSAWREPVKEAFEKIGITLHDDVVIGRSGHTSFRAKGLL